MDYDDSQLAAIAHATRNGDCIINGYAGTGKTTIIAAIADALDNQVELMAPTGKAAANVRDKVGIPAYTIHRALLWDGDVFRRKDRITATTIVDESSMIDSAMLATLIGFARGRIILIGDAAQLPPVGPGAPFHDLIDLRPEIVHTLTKCYRASGAVHIASNAIRRGEAPEKAMSSDGEHWRMITTGDAEATIAKIAEWVKAGKYDPMQDMILAPVYGDGATDGGIDRINAAVKAILNPSEDEFAVGDRVLNNKNFSDLDFWNGDVGTITAIDVDGNYWVRLDRTPEEVCCRKEQKRELTHGWCMSVHKSQGSQARRVFFVCLKQHRHMLHRSLIYTAVTRARESCIVLGELSAFYEGINKDQRKMTALRAWQQKGAAA